jgi:hypothetical protein
MRAPLRAYGNEPKLPKPVRNSVLRAFRYME